MELEITSNANFFLARKEITLRGIELCRNQIDPSNEKPFRRALWCHALGQTFPMALKGSIGTFANIVQIEKLAFYIWNKALTSQSVPNYL